jgi:hypothetical protein
MAEAEMERRRESIAVPAGVTVEEFLQQQCEELVAKVYARSAELSRSMRADFAAQKDRFRSAMEARKMEIENTENAGDADNNDRNSNISSQGSGSRPQRRAAVEASKSFVATGTRGRGGVRAAGVPVSLLCTTKGPYHDQAFHLNVVPGKPCFVGRSRGVKFKRNGVSLPQDLEVSTTHGKIQASADGTTVTFEDCDSTNGTRINGEPLPPKDPRVLSNGDELVIGSNSFVVTSLPESDIDE